MHLIYSNDHDASFWSDCCVELFAINALPLIVESSSSNLSEPQSNSVLTRGLLTAKLIAVFPAELAWFGAELPRLA